MARKKTSVESTSNTVFNELASNEYSKLLGDAIDKIIIRDYGHYKAPPPIITPTKIVPLDYLLGGGIVSSKPVMISSTPETGYRLAC